MAIVVHGVRQSPNTNGFTTPAFDSTGSKFGVAGVTLFSATTVTLTDNKGNTWTRFAGSTGGGPTSQLFYCEAPNVGTGHTLTLTFTTQYGCIEYAFLSDGLLHDGSNARAASWSSGATLKPGSTTPSAANAWLFTHAVAGGSGAGPYSIDAGFAILDQANFISGQAFGGALAYKTLTTASAQDPAWTGGFGAGGYGGTAVIGAFVPPPPPSAPASLTATAVSSSAINLTWTASTGGGGVTGYSVERCSGVGCSTFSEVGTPTATTFSDTGLTAGTSYSYRVRANSPAGFSSYSSTATAVTPGAPATGAVVRSVSSVITFAGVVLTDVISARGQVAADSGWPTCSVFVTAKPATGNEEDTLTVVAGTGNNVTRFTGRVRRFRPSAFPKGVEIVAMGTLAYAAEWSPAADLDGNGFIFDDEFPSGATDQALVAWALGFVPGISYVGADIQGTGITLGLEAPEAFDWKPGTSAWQYVQQIDRATLYRTYQQRDGTIRRVQMIGHPSSTTTTFTLANQDILEGSTGERNTEQTRNAAIVRGHDYGDNLGPTLGMAYGANDFQGDATTTALRHPEEFSSDLIEDGSDDTGVPLGYGGIDAQDIADAILNDVNKEFVEASVQSWRDDTHGPGQTCLLDSLDRLAIGEKMWVMGYAWEVDDGWTSTYRLSGGGLEQPYTPPPV